MARKSARAVPAKAVGGRRSKTSRGGAKAGHGRPTPASKKAPAAKKAAHASRASLEAVRDDALRRRSPEPARQEEPRRVEMPERAEPQKPSREAEVGSRVSPGIAEAGIREPAPSMPPMPQMPPMPAMPQLPFANMGLPFQGMGLQSLFPGLPIPANPMALQQLGQLNFEAALFIARRSIAATEGLLQLMRCRTMPEVWRVQMTLILDALLDFQKLTMRLAKSPNDG